MRPSIHPGQRKPGSHQRSTALHPAAAHQASIHVLGKHLHVRTGLSALLALWFSLLAAWAQPLPPAPTRHFTDGAGLVSPAITAQLNQRLEQFERDSSVQVVVTTFPSLPEGAALEDYTHRIFEAWKIGRKGLDNGVALFLFARERRLRIEVGYGLEGAIPDALAKRIIEEQIVPEFRRGSFEQGLVAGANALMAAARGEYKGTGRTVAQGNRTRSAPGLFQLAIFAFFILAYIASIRQGRRGTYYNPRGVRHGTHWGGGFGSGGGWGGGGGGGGGFSGGGGRSGGGGASGGW